MIIKSLHLVNFRNLGEKYLDFSDRINLIHGENGQGKTNLVEAIYLMNHSKSFRTRIDKQMIAKEKETAYIKGNIKSDKTAHTIDIRLSKNSPKAINLNGYPLDKISDMIGVINIVIFSPEDVAIVSGSPSERRSFIDREISQIKPIYYPLISKYQSILKNKNILLKTPNPNPTMLDIYDEQISKLSEKIIKYREDFLKKLSFIAGENNYYISDEKDTLNIEYQPSFTAKDKKGIYEELLQNRNKDIEYCSSSKGVHRDDMLLKIGDMDIKQYGSQGQKKTAAISLKLAEIDLCYEEKGQYPIVILDDIYSELDKNRRSLITSKFKEIQLFITATDKILLNNTVYFHVQNGDFIT